MEEENIFLYHFFFPFLLLIIRSQLVWHTQIESNSSIFQFQLIPHQKVNKNLFQVKPQSKACQNSSLLHIFIILSPEKNATRFFIDFAGRVASL